MTKSQISVRIPSSLLEKLNGYVDNTGATKTEVIVGALAQYLGSAKDIPVMQRIAQLEERIATLEGEIKRIAYPQ